MSTYTAEMPGPIAEGCLESNLMPEQPIGKFLKLFLLSKRHQRAI